MTWPVAAVLVAASVLVAGVIGTLGFLVGRARRSTRVVDPIGRPVETGTEMLEAQRAKLITAMIEARDLTGSRALAERLDAALADAGIEVLAPANCCFDPHAHHAVHAAATEDAELHDRIAEVERVGYRDGDRVLRRPEVVVYRHDRAPR